MIFIKKNNILLLLLLVTEFLQQQHVGNGKLDHFVWCICLHINNLCETKSVTLTEKTTIACSTSKKFLFFGLFGEKSQAAVY